MNATIIDCMRENAHLRGAQTAFRFLSGPDLTARDLSHAALWREAAAVACFLSRIAAPGSRVMLFYPPGLEYVTAFYGCLQAGMVAVPLYPPRRNVKSDRVLRVAQSCGSTIALTTAAELPAVKAAWDEQNSCGLPLDFHATDAMADAPPDYAAPALDSRAPAFLQYTSGSTGTPKGVVITHGNIVANTRHLSLTSTGNADDVFVNWLPLFHDLGLVTAVLWPVYLGTQSVLMAPATFVREPSSWLEAITRYRGTMCGAPNFAFDLCTQKIGSEELGGFDLSSWRVAYNAAEPVRAQTLDDFSRKFAACGFDAHAFYPSYGMAEATVMIAGGVASAPPICLSADKRALGQRSLAPAISGDGDNGESVRVVACGRALPPHDLKIVDPETRRVLPEGAVGEIWFSGPSVSPGYWNLPEQTGETFGQKIAGDDSGIGYLRTGDLGALYQGEVVIAGRIKDIVILNGRNYYPQDIEASAAAAHGAVRPGHVAAFAQVEDGIEHLVVAAEIEREQFRTVAAEEVIAAVVARIVEEHEITPERVVLLKPYRMPMTSSGKIQRRQARQMLEDGELEAIADSRDTRGQIENKHAPPRTPSETVLCQIWAQVLELPRVGIHDDFFGIGGESIAAIRMAAELRKHFAVAETDLPLLQEYPTVAQLAAHLDLVARHAEQGASGKRSGKAVRI